MIPRGLLSIKLPINFPAFQALGKFILDDTLPTTEELESVVKRMLNEVLEYLEEHNIKFEDNSLYLN